LRLGLSFSLRPCAESHAIPPLLAVRSLAVIVCVVSLLACSQQQADEGGAACPASLSDLAIAAHEPAKGLEVSTAPVPAADRSPAGEVGKLATFNVQGVATYERYFPKSSGEGLDYSGSSANLPIRRAVVQVIQSPSTVVATGRTDDGGNYLIATTAPTGATLFIRVLARSTVSNYQPDGLNPVGPDGNCNGASWDVRVVNNVTNNAFSQSDYSLRAQYALDSTTFLAPSSGTVSAPTSNAAMTWNGTNAYTQRAGAPFALLDTMIAGLETACQGRADINFPLLYVNWSSENTTTSGNRYQGNIATSFFTTETSSQVANLYILGRVNVDTDELDRHIVAHEFAHYLENKIYRSDSVGGSHSVRDSLDPRLAFGEGFGNAFSAFVHYDAVSNTESNVYKDSNGNAQATGFSIDVSTPPADTPGGGTYIHDDRGPWSETAVQHFLWRIWSNAASARTYSKIHEVLEGDHKVTPAFTNVLTFASHYAKRFGLTADALQTWWTSGSIMNTTINGLCEAGCSGGSSVFSVWDPGNFLGLDYGPSRRYRQGTFGAVQSAAFWQLYRPLASGANVATAHDSVKWGGYSASSTHFNKFGLRRLYKVTATSSRTTVRVSSISQTGETCSSADLLDLAAYRKGALLAVDESSSGATSNCPAVTFCSIPGEIYVLEVAGFGNVSGYDLEVSP
jgi:hypothetical protein